MERSSTRDKDEKVVIQWKDVFYSTIVKDPKQSKFGKTVYKTKHILNGVSGVAESGQLLAILGPTGCGKTSLLNVLAARVSTAGKSLSQLRGTIAVNGQRRVESKFRKISAYVLQDDNMYPHLTVFETLMLSAHFFLPEELSDEEKTSIVNAVIAELGLIKAKDTIIGDEKVRGVSGGERKRASVAVQLLSDPAVLFLDEPTSGLDAFQSQAIMESMKAMADSGRCVISVIHQPRSSIYEMFDRLLILSEGNTMFYGKAKAAVGYFEGLGHRCPSNFNPPDFFLDLLSPDNRSPESEQESRNRIQSLSAEWRKFEDQNESMLLKSDSLDLGNVDSMKIKSIGTKSTFTKTRRNFILLCWRSFASQYRNVPAIVIKIIFSVFFALIIGGIYSNIGYSQASVMNRLGSLFFIVINQAFSNVTAVLNSFPSEKLIVNRERNGRAYNAVSYFCAKVIVELPLNLLPTIIFGCIIYFLIGFKSGVAFLYFLLILMMTNFVACSLGLAISAFAPTVDFANAIGPPLVIIGILFGGFYISVDSLPVVADWIPYMSMMKWAFEALMINEFTGLKFDCAPTEQNCIYTGEQELENLGFGHHTTSYAVFGLGMLLVAYLLSAFVILYFNVLTFLPLGHTGEKFRKAMGATEGSAVQDADDSSNKKAVVAEV